MDGDVDLVGVDIGTIQTPMSECLTRKRAGVSYAPSGEAARWPKVGTGGAIMS